MHGDLAQQAEAVASSLLQRTVALLSSPSSRHTEHAERLRQQVLPAAERLAALFDAYCHLPDQQAAVNLEVARAAAGRSCAYLSCPNVQGGGGALAGEGAGSKRCR